MRVKMSDTEFYMTYARSRPKEIVPYAEKHSVPLMTNAAHRWSDAKNRFNNLWKYNTNHIVDSGGYNVQRNYGEYPWSVEEYHEWLSQQEFKWAAIMDYACEERFDELHTVDTRVDKTIDNAVEHFNQDPDYELLPVLQGRDIDTYVECYDRMKEYGIPMKKVGLGTVCRISSSHEIIDTEKKIRDRCKDIEFIHGFGVKIEAFRMGATFDSADSQAWVYAASNGTAYLYNNDYKLTQIDMDSDSKTRTIQSFKAYYEYVRDLIDTEPEAIQEYKGNGSGKSSKVSKTQLETIECECGFSGKQSKVIEHSIQENHTIELE